MKHSSMIIYQSKNGAIELRSDASKETIWATQAQMAFIFDVQPQAITKHLKNIYSEKELSYKATCSKMEQVQIEGKRRVKRTVEIYNLDAIISVGYRISSKTGTLFRQWATKTLRTHIIDGYTINKKRLAGNYHAFQKAIVHMQSLLPQKTDINTKDILSLVSIFAETWFSLQAFDKGIKQNVKITKTSIEITSKDLLQGIDSLKNKLLKKSEAGNLFAVERNKESIEGIIGNIFQSFGKVDVYPSNEEKSAHLLYFIVKNHPFIDGNKRCGAFAFVWFLKKNGLLNIDKLTPSTLTALTLLIAQSDPKDKERMINLVVLIIGKKN
jgi:prophage maintenance system killer protein